MQAKPKFAAPLGRELGERQDQGDQKFREQRRGHEEPHERCEDRERSLSVPKDRLQRRDAAGHSHHDHTPTAHFPSRVVGATAKRRRFSTGSRW